MKSGKGYVPCLFSGKFWPPPAGNTFPHTCSAHQHHVSIINRPESRGDTSYINANIASQYKSTMRRSKSTARPSTSPLGTGSSMPYSLASQQSRLKVRYVAGVMRPCRSPERHIHTIQALEAQSF
ncbi:hypothetical protein BDZ91DRAFT_548016 [Kalaharituber pfeilii]|nr:hypothetical protein BDZ91DRAFT_548016 [Kalaharituber pfeilii]